VGFPCYLLQRVRQASPVSSTNTPAVAAASCDEAEPAVFVHAVQPTDTTLLTCAQVSVNCTFHLNICLCCPACNAMSVSTQQQSSRKACTDTQPLHAKLYNKYQHTSRTKHEGSPDPWMQSCTLKQDCAYVQRCHHPLYCAAA
jgi:hypothetical protein